MNCCQQQTPEYFDAIKNNDLEKVKQMAKHANFDGRETDATKNIYNGFGGIHYAILAKNQEIFEYLFEQQWQLLTQTDVQMSLEAGSLFAKQCKFSVAADSNILMLALLLNNEKAVEFISKKIQSDDKYKKLLQQVNRFNLSVYSILCLSLMPVAKELMTKYTEAFNVIKNGDLSPLMACAYFCKIESLKTIVEQAEKDEKFKPQFVEQLKGLNYKQQTFEEVSKQSDQDKTFGVTEEQRQEFQQYASEIYNKYTEKKAEEKKTEEEKKETVEVASEQKQE